MYETCSDCINHYGCTLSLTNYRNCGADNNAQHVGLFCDNCNDVCTSAFKLSDWFNRGPSKTYTARRILMMMTTTNQQAEVFCKAELAERCLNNEDLFRRVLSAFQVGFADDLKQLEEQLVDKQIDEIGKTAHRMKGSAGNAAAYRLQKVASELESVAAGGNLKQSCSLVSQLRNEWSEFQAIAGHSDPTPG